MDGKIILFPDVGDVFEDVSLACFFRPLLTKRYQVGERVYLIHLLSTDGVFCEAPFMYAENGFFGFAYSHGKYQFLGDKGVFGKSNFNEVYQVLMADFEGKKDEYLNGKVSDAAYLEQIEPVVERVAQFTEEQDAMYFAQSLYCYLFTKYHYEKTGEFKHILELTSGYGHDESSILLSEKAMQGDLEEFFVNMKYNVKNNYKISRKMVVCGALGDRFTLYGGVSIAFLDEAADKVYILEHHS